MSPDREKVPDYLLERVAAGDLPATERAALLDSLSREPGGPERLAALAREDAEALSRIPAAAVAAQVTERARPRRGGVGWQLVPAATALLAVLFVSTWRPQPPGEPADVTRVKGLAPHVVIHRDSRDGATILPSGATARPGDLLQLGYVAGARRYGVIVSIDGAGAATLHYPAAGTTAGALATQRETLLPEAFRLDDAPGFERFLLVTADAPFAVDDVLRAARTLAGRPDAREAALPVDDRLSVSSTLILKEVR